MSWSGGGLFPPWGGLAPPNYRQPSSNQDQLRREAARRRHAEAANSLAEQRRKAEGSAHVKPQKTTACATL